MLLTLLKLERHIPFSLTLCNIFYPPVKPREKAMVMDPR